MRKIWTKNSKRRSMSAALRSTNEDDSNSMAETVESEPSTHVRTLIEPGYDVNLVKHAWLNGVLNASPMQDFNESSLRLFRVELRGSHLYIYRPPSSLNVRSFKLDPDISRSNEGDTPEMDVITLSLSEQHTSAKAETRSVGVSTAATSTTASASTSELAPSKNSETLSLVSEKMINFAPLSDNGQPIPELENVSYNSPIAPHPQLIYDASSGSFSSTSPLEALVHFFLFADNSTQEKSVRQLKLIFPLLPKFDEVLRLIHTFLHAVLNGKSANFEPTPELLKRVVSLIQHIDENFSGFLLKSNIAPYIPKILELMNDNGQVSLMEGITQLQESIILKQQALLGLMESADATNKSSLTAEGIFEALNSETFMNKVNLLDLVAVVGEIDLMFFRSWNSSLDKSLLLFASICDDSPGDHFYKKNPLIFDNEIHLHYLSRLFVHHMFIENMHSSHEKLARVLERWIDLGCLLDKSGNMSSWLGISSIILSQPVLRLTAVWAHVGEDYVNLLKKDWSPILFELDRRHLSNTSGVTLPENVSRSSGKCDSTLGSKESYHIMAPRGLGKIYPKEKVIPYFGDLFIDNTKQTSIVELETLWKKITYSFERWNEYLENLTNSPEIISYNQDVLRRYDSMGFIFSNESLNQVLYLGLKKEEKKAPSSMSTDSVTQTRDVVDGQRQIQNDLRAKLLHLLELNCESISIHTVMEHSLHLEPSMKEGYLRPLDNDGFNVTSMTSSKETLSSFTAASGRSSSTADTVEPLSSQRPGPRSETMSEKPLPTLNLEYYKINLAKYDELAPQNHSDSSRNREPQDLVIDNDLVLRIDDFTTDYESNVIPVTSASPALGTSRQQSDDGGLGIDVDDIMNSEKFNNFSLPTESESAEGNHANKKRHSFGLVSRQSSRISNHSVERYIPRFATMDKLIDLLLIDSKYFDKAHLIDLNEYRFVFMLNYSSFISTRELLERLAQRFVQSGNAVISVMKRSFMQKQNTYDPLAFGSFPKWEADEGVDLSRLGEVDYKLLLQIQANILKVLIILLSNFFSSFQNDLSNKNVMIRLLKLFSNEILQWYNSKKIDTELNEPFEILVELYKRVKSLFIKKMYRPIELPRFDLMLAKEFQFSRITHEVPMNRNLPSHRNIHKVEKFLIKFNKLLATLYQGIRSEDWFSVFKIIENLHVKHSLLNYETQKPDTPEVDLKISDVFYYLESLYESSAREKVLSKFPAVFKKLYSLYRKFKTYLLIQLCDESISEEERLDRMKTLLLMVSISRLKMDESVFIFEGDKSHIPTCIETAIISVFYSPGSRLLAQSWLKTSSNVNMNGADPKSACSEFEFLLPRHLSQTSMLTPNEPLLPCFGWIIQNLIQINECPSFHRNAVNFNKRVFLYKFVKELKVEETKIDELHKDTKEFDFLFKLDDSPAMMFSAKTGPSLTQDMFFSRSLKRQKFINAQDDQRRGLNLKSHTFTPEQVQAISGASNNHSKRHSMAYKTPSSSRFKISGLFNKSRTFGHTTGHERAVTYKELPDPATVADPRQKPVLIVQLKDKKIFPVYLLQYCFKFDTQSTNEACFFQTASENDAKSWLRSLNYANRHWFLSKSINLRSDHTHTTFGVPLATVCARDGLESPAILKLIYNAIEGDGLDEVGIYRISASLSELSGVKQEINKTGTMNLIHRTVDVHTLTSCVKSFFRELPDALLTDQVIDMLCPSRQSSIGDQAFTKSDAGGIKKALSMLPRQNYCTLKDLICHLNNVVSHNETNKMTCSNLATVIGPALTEASNLESLITNFGSMNHILELLIGNYMEIFDP